MGPEETGVAMLNAVVGELLVVAVFAAIGLGLLVIYWGLGGGLWNWTQERKERKELERAEVDDRERALEWDQERQAELREWLEHGILPSPVSRVYPAYPEFTWEWTRLQAHGYQLDHDPVLLADGQLMVTYSRQPALRIAK
jgi:hypothetical protein